jgi:hypothetical protein
MSKIATAAFLSVILLGLVSRLSADALTLIPDVKITEAAGSRGELNANLRIYLKNDTDKVIVLPTRGFSSIVSVDGETVSVILLFQPDEMVKGMRVVRPLASFLPVEISKNEMAEAEFNFLWPSTVQRNAPVKVTFEIDAATARRYNLWSGSITAYSETKPTSLKK